MSSPVVIPLSGQMGYSFCSDENASICPFHLDHIDAGYGSADDVVVDLACEDGTIDELRLTSLSLSLAQPAFGVGTTTSVGFPEGGLRFDLSLDVNGLPFSVRRPNTGLATGTVSIMGDSSAFFITGVDFSVSMPCNDSHASVSARLAIESAGLQESPPTILLSRPSAICGSPLLLRADVHDVDADLATIRWRMDGVLLSEDVEQVIPTGAHRLEVIAKDARGATTSKEISFTCS